MSAKSLLTTSSGEPAAVVHRQKGAFDFQSVHYVKLLFFLLIDGFSPLLKGFCLDLPCPPTFVVLEGFGKDLFHSGLVN